MIGASSTYHCLKRGNKTSLGILGLKHVKINGLNIDPPQYSYDRGNAGRLHPGLWKIPPRLFGKSHPGFWKIPPRLLENPTQGSGKLQNFHKPCDYTFLDKASFRRKIVKMTTLCRAKLNHLYVRVKNTIYLLK